MSAAEGPIWMSIHRQDAVLRGSQALRPVLERLAASFVPPPDRLEVTGLQPRAVNGWLDAPVMKALDRKRGMVVLTGGGARTDLHQMGTTILTVRFAPGPPADEVRALFVDLCTLLGATYGRCHYEAADRALYDRHYRDRERTFYADGLFWLNFFGPAEEARQGGAGLERLPGARAERLAGGLLVQVGDTPEDAASPAGEAALAAATAAMPPLPGAAPAASGDGGDGDAGDDTAGGVLPAPLTTIDGVRGHLDPVDRAFWVTRHLDPPRALAGDEVARLAGLRGRGSPEVSQVHVLFSGEEAASLSRAALSAAGVGAWYISPSTGMPAEL